MHLSACIVLLFLRLHYTETLQASTVVAAQQPSNAYNQTSVQERPQNRHELRPNSVSESVVELKRSPQKYDNSTAEKIQPQKKRIPMKYIIIFRIIRAFSTTGLIITFLVYVLRGSLRSKLINKCLLAYIFTLICWDFGEIPWLLKCDIAINLVDSFILASFSWLTILCFELRHITRHICQSRCSTKKKFYKYCLLACSGPLILLLITVLVELYYTTHPISDLCKVKWTRPNNQDCNNFIIPILVSANVYMYLEMTYLLFIKEQKWKENTKDMKRHKRRSKTRFLLYLKLFSITGMSWVAHTSMYVLEINDHFEADAACAISKLRGIPIFLIFCCNRKVYTNLTKKKTMRSKYESRKDPTVFITMRTRK